MPELHATDLRTYLECRRKYKYAYMDRLTSDVPTADYFSFGTLWHKVMAAHYSGELVDNVLNNHEDEEVARNQRTLYGLYCKEYADEKLQIASIEQSIKFPFKGLDLTFTMDLLTLKSNHKYKIIDHKSYKSFPNQNLLTRDFQCTFYFWGATKVGIPVDEFVFNVVRKGTPELPAVLKNGSFSRSQATLANTDYHVYKKLVDMAGCADEYQAELEFLKNRGSNFFKRYSQRRTEKQLEIFESHLLTMLDEIHSDKTVFYPHSQLGCSHCMYEFLCSAEDQGTDTTNIRQSLFRLKEDTER